MWVDDFLDGLVVFPSLESEVDFGSSLEWLIRSWLAPEFLCWDVLYERSASI